MDPLTWTLIAAALLIAAIAVADAFRRRKLASVRAKEEQKQLHDARRWQRIEAARGREARH